MADSGGCFEIPIRRFDLSARAFAGRRSGRRVDDAHVRYASPEARQRSEPRSTAGRSPGPKTSPHLRQSARVNEKVLSAQICCACT